MWISKVGALAPVGQRPEVAAFLLCLRNCKEGRVTGLKGKRSRKTGQSPSHFSVLSAGEQLQGEVRPDLVGTCRPL